MLFRDEMSKRIRRAFAVTERKEHHTLREKGVRPYPNLLRCTNQTHVRYLEILGTATCVCVFIAVFVKRLSPFLCDIGAAGSTNYTHVQP